ncbi:DNA-binding protein [Vibrio navarrensis]|uniref:Helix-turn-helix transcriptional regulator n=1 Tax=Vibrio navarrensis TaxID=29495 RepID=A0AAJ4IFI9_9VIBR|nr:MULTISPECIES: helix-turn-helix transcriptional regulator [Vibrio]KJR39100.1 DNA-binding protein [Vibrio sp. S234-5]MBE3654614.1 DNA-binding protein [Vibrio navarrensis]MBE3660490.1 DNA-binding protein [Vibrio navarrensis]MBE4602753.1 DNA-binding protein [Vibrio navarrensis]QPL55742.1 helix-turn-helix transcriptional regulator [Vibrio navarrensis]
MSFAQRLNTLIGEESISGFARRVGLSEALIRKYLNGSEPSLSKANQIAVRANCSLEWLATGCGYLYRQAEVVDAPAYRMAYQHVTGQKLNEQEWPNQQQIIAGYQYLRAHKKADGFLDKEGMAAFISRSSLAEKNE